jgi:biopolymer transport protein ExbB
MSNNNSSALKETMQSWINIIIIVACITTGWIVYKFVMGNPVNFEGGNPEGHPLPGNFLAIIYKGGFIVPLLIAVNLIVLTFSIERMISLARANGKGRLSTFIREIQDLLSEDRIEEAKELCDEQKGSLANVVKSGLHRYRDLQEDQNLPNDQKVVALQKDIEESTALELPNLSRNLVIMSTIASIAVLIGLIGTVLGMIKAFAALATAGSPDALALATGISEALINTAFGITGSTLAIILFNYFNSKVDAMSYKIDEAGFSIAQTFASTLKK